MKQIHEPTRDDVMDGYILAREDGASLADWQARYPQFSDDLAEFEAFLRIDELVSDEQCTILNTEEEILKKFNKLRGYLTHMLGAESHITKSQWGYRNYYCTEVGGRDERDLAKLEAIGLVRRGFTINEGEDVYYFATEKGMDAIGLTKEQKKRALDQ